MGDPEADVADHRPLGLVASLRRMFATMLALVHTRVELFTTEIEEEIQFARDILWLAELK